jgi:Cation transporting ATPase, C-terminus
MLFLILSMPLLLSTILILVVDVGTDMWPAISLAYEKPESDIMKRKPRRVGVDRLVNRRLISFAYLQIGVMQALAGTYVGFVVMNDYGIGPSALPGSNRYSNWGSSQGDRLRWMYTEKKSFSDAAFNADFFNSEYDPFTSFFSKTPLPGFAQQIEEEFAKVSTTEGGTGEQFSNMFKAIGFVTGRPACRPFSCAGRSTANDLSCFLSADSGIVTYDGISGDAANPNIIDGDGDEEGCFELWSVEQQEEVLRRSQSAYLVSIIMVCFSQLCPGNFVLYTFSLVPLVHANNVYNDYVLSSIIARQHLLIDRYNGPIC